MKNRFDPSLHRLGLSLLTAGSLLCLNACGGGGGGSGELIAGIGGTGIDNSGTESGIGGTGFSSTGTLDGTGSIFVNGVRFDVDDAEVFVNGQPASEADLGLGMVVTVTGNVDDNGSSGVAARVDYDSLLEGPVSSIERNADNSSARMQVLGQVVIIERTSTVFEDSNFDTLAAGEIVEISGFLDEEGRIRATRIEGSDDDDVSLIGTIADLDGLLFRIGNQLVDAGTATLTDIPGGSLANGTIVEVDGELVGDRVVAIRIEGVDQPGTTLQVDDQIAALGSIRAFNGPGDFVVEGLPVDAGNAVINTRGFTLGNGLVVEVRGVWDGNRLIASDVSARRGRIEIEAPVAAINSDSGTISFRFGAEELSVRTDARTLFDDDRDNIEYLKITDIAIGDFLEVEALEDSGSLLATRIDRDDDSNETELQAPVQSFVDGISVTMLGVTFDVTRAEFENAADDDIDPALFFASLSEGALLKVSDKQPTDGFAEEVEFEFATALPGDREFSDDDEERLDDAQLPDALLAYLNENYPGAVIAFAERDDDEIEVYLTDGTELVFSLDGVFIESDDDDDDRDDDDLDDADDDIDDDDKDDDADDGVDDDDKDDDIDDDDKDDDADDDDKDDDTRR
jgi:hypothetical protein